MLAGQIAAEFMERREGLATDGSPQRIHAATEALAQHASNQGILRDAFCVFDGCLRSVGRCTLSHYVGKNVLNFSGRITVIRTGLTSKSGRGERITNTFELLDTLMRPRPDFEAVYDALSARYATVR